MPEKHLYEYAVIRLVPKVERGECMNVGVVLYSKALKFLDFKYEVKQDRLMAFSPDTDFSEVCQHLESFNKICQSTPDSGFLGLQDIASRFRWLTAKRSTIIQPYEVHPGYCENPEIEIQDIFEKMVK
jgi:hypothetical protein